MQKFLRTLTLLAFFAVPWVMQGQNVSSYEFDQPAAAAFTSISSSGTAADLSANYADVSMNHAFALGETSISQSSAKLRIYRDGHVEVLDGTTVRGTLAPLQYSGMTGGTVYYRAQPTVTTVEWRKVSAGTNNVLTFQLKVYSDNRVQFCYGPMTLGGSASVQTYLSDGTNNFYCSGNNWGTITKSTSSATRTLSSAYHPDYTPTNATSGTGVVYSFTRPTCLRPATLSVGTQTGKWDTLFVTWGLADGDNQVVKYELAYSTQEGFNADTVDNAHRITITNSAATSAKISGLHGNTPYYVALRKFCSQSTASSWLYKTTATTTPSSCPAPAASNFTISSAGVASWTLTSYPNITSIDIYYSTENVAPDADATPTISNIAVSAGSIDLGARADIAATSNTTWYVWFRGHCTVDGGTTLNWVSKSFKTPCGTTDVPYSENFSSYSGFASTSYPYYGPSVLPDCWNLYSNGTNTASTSGSTSYFGGVGVATGTSYGSMEGYNNFLCLPIYVIGANTTSSSYVNYHNQRGDTKIAVLPQLNQPLSNLIISFNYKIQTANTATGQNTALELGYIVGSDVTTFHSMQTYPGTTNAVQTVSELSLATLAASAPANARLAFKYSGTHNGTSTTSNGTNYCGIDNVVVEPIPSCFTPGDVAVAGLTYTSATVSWTGTADSYLVEARQGDVVVASATSTSNTATIQGLTANTSYDIYVKGTCGSEQSKWSLPLSIYTGYCIPTPSSTDGSGLTGVDFGETEAVHNSLSNGKLYQDFSTMVGTGYRGQNLDIALTYKTGYTYGTIIWVDWNQNMVFEGDEVVYVGTSTSSNPTTLNASFAIPATQALGDYRMRIAGADSYYDSYVGSIAAAANANPCPTSTYTCVQDYTLRVVAVPTCFKPTNLAAVPGTGDNANSVTLSWTENSASTPDHWELSYWKAGSTDVVTINVTGTPTAGTMTYTLNYLDMGTTYNWQVRDVCVPGEDISAWSDVNEFATGCISNSETQVDGTVTYTMVSGTNPDLTLTEHGAIIYDDGGPSGDYSSSQNQYLTVYPSTSSAKVHLYDPSASTEGSSWDYLIVYNGVGTTGTQLGEVRGTGVSLDVTSTDATGAVTIYFISDGSVTKSGWAIQATEIGCDMGTCVPPTAELTPSAVTNGELTIAFDGDDDYGYICVLQGTDITGLTGTTTTADEVTLTGLTPGATYDVYVYSVCSGTAGRMVRYGVTLPVIPDCKVQTDFAVSNLTYTTATVTWAQVGGAIPANGWTVRYSDEAFNPLTAAATDYTELTVPSAATATLNLTGLHNGNTYYIYTMADCGNLGVTPEWTAYSFTTPAIEGPSSVSLSNLTSSSATLTWEDSNTPVITNWSVAYSTTYPFDADAAAITVNNTPTYTFTGLTDNTDYYVAIRANYTTDETGSWNFYGPVTTLCNTITIDADNYYTEDFESYNSGSSYIPDCWFRTADYTGTYINSGSYPHSGSKYLDFHSGNATNRYMVLPLFTQPAAGLQMTFWTRPESNTNSSCATLQVGYMTDVENISTFVPVAEYAYNDWTTAAYMEKTVNFPMNMPANARIALYHTSTSGWYWFVDDITVSPNPSCWSPDSLVVKDAGMNSITLAWRENSPVPATRWDVSYGIGITDPEEGTIAQTTNRIAYVINNLNSATTYNVYVRAHCSDSEQSDWVGPINVTTACPVFAMPFKESFDDITSGIPVCWDNSNATITTASYNWNSYATGNSGRGLRFNSYNASNGQYSYLATPAIALADSAVLSFWYKNPTGGDFSVFASTDDGVTMNTIATGLTGQSSWIQMSYTLGEEYIGENVKIYFKATSNYGSGDAYIYLDDVKIKAAEVTTPLPNAGATIVACDKLITPTLDDNDNYGNNITATYILNTTPGNVVTIDGDYDLEYGYDFLYVYEGTGADALCVDTLTGTVEGYTYKTNSYDWPNKGGIKLVFVTDGDNALAHNGFHFSLTCEAPEMAPDADPQVVEVNGTYTWAAPTGNGETYTNQVVETGLVYDPEAIAEVADDLVRTYTFTQKNVGGNDSIMHTLQLTVHPTYHRSYTYSLCERDSVVFYGQTYKTTGVYTDSLTAQVGNADSVGVLTLNVNAAPVAYIYYNNRNTNGTLTGICDGALTTLEGRSNLTSATYQWDGQTAGTTYQVTPTDGIAYNVVATDPATGCTSLPTTVTVATVPVSTPAINATLDTLCAGQSTTLTVSDASNLEGVTYRWTSGTSNLGAGTTITVTPATTTTYTVTATTATGCATTAEKTIVVNQLPVVTAIATAEVCRDSVITLTATEGFSSYLWSTGATTATATDNPNVTGNYTVTVVDANGCQNSATTNTVTVHPSYRQDVEASECVNNLPYTFGTQSLSENGLYTETFTIAHGCDSVVNLTFSVQDTAVFNSQRELCFGTEFTFGEGIYQQSYTAMHTGVISYLDTTSGCPAYYRLNLTVNMPAASSFDLTECDSYTWNLTDETYTVSGAYPVTLKTIKGCDSVVTMNLTVNYSNTGIDNQVACDEFEWIDGAVYTANNNTATFTLKNAAQCDSVVTLNLTVNHKNFTIDHYNVCNAYTFTWSDGNVYALSVPASDNITDTVAEPNAEGCDSILVLDLVLNPVASGDTLNVEEVTACDEYVVEVFNAETCTDETLYLTDSGYYEFRVHNATLGRDQWRRIHLNMGNSRNKTIPVRTCDFYTWVVNEGTADEYEVGTYTESGTYSYRKANLDGCDSVFNLRLTLRYTTNLYNDTAAICQNGTWEQGSFSIKGDDQRLHIGENIIAWNTTQRDYADGCDIVENVVLTVNKVYTPDDFDTVRLLALRESDFNEYDGGEHKYFYYLEFPADEVSADQAMPLYLEDNAYTDTLEVVYEFNSNEGCDAKRVVLYHVIPTTYDTVTIARCNSFVWEVNGKKYDHSYDPYLEDADDYFYHTVNAQGGDSIIWLNLTINDSIVVNENHYFCSEFMGPDSVLYRENMTWRNVDVSIYSCDSIHYDNYIVLPTSMTHLNMVTNVPYEWQNGDGHTYSNDTTVWYVTQTVAYNETDEHGHLTGEYRQCDSILVLHLTMVNDTAVVCENSLPYTYDAMGIVLDGLSSGQPTWMAPLDNDAIQANLEYETFFGYSNPGQWTQFRSRFFPGQHNGMHTVLGTEVANNNSNYVTVDLQVNGQTMASQTIDNAATWSWNYVDFDTPVRISDDDTVDFVYTMESEYAMYVSSNSANIGHPDNYQYRIVETDEWYSMTAPRNLNTWSYFGYGDDYYYRSINEDHNDTILYYVVNSNTFRNLDTLTCAPLAWIDGKTYAEDTTGVLYTLAGGNANGCDSIVALNLHVGTPTVGSDTVDVVACASYTWKVNSFNYEAGQYEDVTVNSQAYTASGFYTFNATNRTGCDSTLVLNLTVNPAHNVVVEQPACYEYTWTPMTYNVVSGDYEALAPIDYTASDSTVLTLTNMYGCDSIVTMKVTINDSVVVIGPDSVVNAGSFFYEGQLLIAPYADTVRALFTAANGCDSIYKFVLRLNFGTTVNEVVNNCGDYTWRNGKTYTWIPAADRVNPIFNYAERTGTGADEWIPVTDFPQDTTWTTVDNNPDAKVIDKIYILALTLQEASVEYKEATLPMSWESYTDSLYTYTWSNNICGHDTTVYDTAHYMGTPYCDSVVYYTLNLRYNYRTLDTLYYCYEDSTYTTQNGKVWNLTAGDKTLVFDTLNAGTLAEEVDSIYINRHEFIGSTETPAAAFFCDTYTWHENEYTVSGTYYDTAEVALKGGLKCDSVVSITLNFHYSTDSVFFATACDEYTWAGIVFDTTGIFVIDTTDAGDTLRNVAGCDSTATLNLTIHYSLSHDTIVEVCDHFTWDRTSTDYTSSIYDRSVYIVGQDVYGCDDSLFLVLTVNKSVNTYDTVNEFGHNYRLNGNIYTAPFESGVTEGNSSVLSTDPAHPGYFELFQLQTVAGCDSNAYVYLHVSNYVPVQRDTAVCGEYTWSETVNVGGNNYEIGTGHTYRSITDAEAIAHNNALYLDVTNNTYITTNPVDTLEDEGIIYSLSLTLSGASFGADTTSYMLSVYESDATAEFNYGTFLSENFYAYYTEKNDTTVTRSVRVGAPNASVCDSIVSLNIHLVYNYDTLDTVFLGTQVDSIVWAAADDTLRNIAFGASSYTRNTVGSGDTTFMVTTMPVFRMEAIVADTIIKDTVCDSVRVTKYEGWHGNRLLTATGTYYDTTVVVKNNVQVDSVTRLQLQVYPTVHHVFEKQACDSYTWNELTSANGVSYRAGGGSEYDSTGVYIDSIYNAADFPGGCTPIDTLKLTVKYAKSSDTVAFACGQFHWDRINYTFTESDSTQTYTITRSFDEGCDSVLHLLLRVNEPVIIDSHIWASDGSYRYTWKSTSEVLPAQATPYERTQTWESVNDTFFCDTTVNLHIHVGNGYYKLTEVNDCDGYTWVNGITYYALDETDTEAPASTLHKHYDENGNTVYDLVNPSYVQHNYDENGVQNDFDSIFILRLSLMPNYDTTVEVNVPISLGTYTFTYGIDDAHRHSVTYTYELTDDEARAYAGDSTVVEEFHLKRAEDEAVQYCDSVITFRLNWINNYDEVLVRDICVTDDTIMWNGERDTYTEDYDNERTIYFYNVVENTEDPLLTRVEYVTVHQHPVTYRTERRVACDSYYWPAGDTTLYDATDMTVETPDEFGCPSVVTLALTIKHNSNTLFEESACESYTWVASNGDTVGTYIASVEELLYNYTNAEGCPSTDTLRLAMHYAVNTIDSIAVCDSMRWDFGTTDSLITTAGTYTHTFQSQYGCDSTVTLTVTIKHAAHNAVTQTTCDSLVWNDTTYYAGGDVLYLYEAENGCASVDTIHLTLVNALHVTTTLVQCDSSYTWVASTGDTVATYNTIGTHTYTYEYTTTATGACVNVDTLHLTINHNNGSFTEAVACHSYDWEVKEYDDVNEEWNDVVLTMTTADTFYHNFVDDNGCAGTDTLVLTIGTMNTYVEMTDTACDHYEWVVNDSIIGTFTNSADLSVYLPNSITGCDSVVLLHLTINNSRMTEVLDTICSDLLPYTWAGTDITMENGGTKDIVVVMGNGCYDTTRYILTVNPVVNTNLTGMVCLGNGYTGYNFDITAEQLNAAGEYLFTRTFSTSHGCDSIVTLTLTVGDTIINDIDTAVCDVYVWRGHVYTESGIYEYTYNNTLGCTTTDVLHLTINVNHGVTENQTVCTSYIWNGNEYSEAGTYTVRFADENGCFADSVLNLTIAPVEQITINQTACTSFTWDSTNITYTESGVYTHEYVNGEGCQGIATLNLTINNGQPTATSAEACDTYTWNGTTYTESGVYTYENSDGNGCDVVDTLYLTIYNSVSTGFAETTCGSYVWDGRYYEQSGVYTFTYQTVNGCDSVATLNLTVNHPVAVTLIDTVCGSYNWNDVSYNASGIYSQTFQALNGCDSVVTLNLTVNPTSTGDTVAVACSSFEWYGVTYVASTTATHTFTNAAGCDSVVTLTLTINQPIVNVEEATACVSYTWHGQVYTTNGTYTYSTYDIHNCAVVDTLNLTINTPLNTTENVEACSSYTWNNEETYTNGGTYSYTFLDINGCSATATLNLTINNPTHSYINETACGSYYWPLTGMTYVEGGNYDYTTTGSNNCDSIVTLTLTINQPTTGMETAQSCTTYVWHGITCDTTGIYTYQTTNLAGCDSTVTLFFTRLQTVQNTINQTACDSYIWNGQTYTTSGSYTYNTSAINGCDSTVTLILTINNSVSENVTESACNSYNWNGQTYTTSGTYSQVFTGRNGCDSTVVMNLTINTPVEVTISESACSSYEWNGETYTTSGNYTYTTTGINGCDSVTTLNLTINTPVYVTIDVEAEGSYYWNGASYTESGEYVYTTTGSNGCDSVTTLNLTVTPLYTVTLVSANSTMGSVSESGTIVENGYFTAEATANDGYIFVAWVNGNDTVSHNHIYVFQVTEDVTLTAIFAEKPVVGIDDVDMDNVTIYSANSTIYVKGVEGQDVHVYDVNGRMMYRELNAPESVEFRMTASGVYLVKVGNAPAKRVVLIR